MKLEHFTYGLFNGHGYVLTKSSGLDAVTTKAMMDKLVALDQDTQLLWNTPLVISCTHIEPATDEFGRVGKWNHTILIDLNDYLTLTQPRRLIEQHFLHKPDKPPAMLQPLTIK